MSNSIDDMMKKFSEMLPEPVRSMQEDLEKNMRGLLENGLQKMNLVTREEFDIQTAVLQRTREKLEAMEARLQSLEAAAHASTTDTADSVTNAPTAATAPDAHISTQQML